MRAKRNASAGGLRGAVPLAILTAGSIVFWGGADSAFAPFSLLPEREGEVQVGVGLGTARLAELA